MKLKQQAKDIPDLSMLRFVAEHGGIGCNRFKFDSFDNPRSVRRVAPDVPEKIVVAKMAALIRRGLVAGCTCGCRGDFELTDKGRSFLASHSPAPLA